METLTIRQYATAHHLPLSGLVGMAEERAAEGAGGAVSADAEMTVAELDEMAAFIDEVGADDLRDAMEGVQYARRELADTESALRDSVREALKEGMAATRVAEVLGVSRARVYQLRDGKR